MPLYKKFTAEDSDIALWRIEEGLPYFEAKFHSHPQIQNENKKLQWFATRHLANLLLGENVTVLKDDTGKPFLETVSHHISISHTPEFAAVIVSKTNSVGIDMEMVNPKVERIAHKFLRDDEIQSIKPNEKIEKLILYWSAKEALYKLYGKRQIEFKTQLLIAPFELKQNGTLNAQIVTTAERIKELKVHYDFFEGHVTSYVVGR